MSKKVRVSDSSGKRQYFCRCGFPRAMELVRGGMAVVCRDPDCWNVFSFQSGWDNGLEKARELKTTIEIDKLEYVRLKRYASELAKRS